MLFGLVEAVGHGGQGAASLCLGTLLEEAHEAGQVRLTVLAAERAQGLRAALVGGKRAAEVGEVVAEVARGMGAGGQERFDLPPARATLPDEVLRRDDDAFLGEAGGAGGH